MKLTEQQIDILKRFALAVVFTSPPTGHGLKPRKFHEVVDVLLDAGLVEGIPVRPTENGYVVLLADDSGLKDDERRAITKAWHKFLAERSKENK